MLLALHKPYGVLSQFTQEHPSHRTLSSLGLPAGVYPIGRLDSDSEGLLLLSDETRWNEKLLHPARAHPREYWAQIERLPAPQSLAQLQQGVRIQGRLTLPCRAWLLDSAPNLSPRDPPIRWRKTVPDYWLALELTEGKNRQVRRMTASIGHPTLRLIRARIGQFWLGSLPPGQWRELNQEEIGKVTERR